MRSSLPLVIFLVLAGFFSWRLILIERGNMPNDIPSTLIGKPAPEFKMPPLLKNKAGLKTADLKGKVTFISYFASWCGGCLAEHPLLADLAGKGAVLAGINYKDSLPGGRAFLKNNGDHYDVVAVDSDGRVGLDFGVYGIPESFLIDKKGIIRYKQTGPLTPEIIEKKILPLISELNK